LHPVYSTGTFLSVIPSMVAQTRVRQLNAAREHVHLIGALAHEAPHILDGIGGLKVSVPAAIGNS
jgi:hypothetical protein